MYNQNNCNSIYTPGWGTESGVWPEIHRWESINPSPLFPLGSAIKSLASDGVLFSCKPHSWLTGDSGIFVWRTVFSSTCYPIFRLLLWELRGPTLGGTSFSLSPPVSQVSQAGLIQLLLSISSALLFLSHSCKSRIFHFSCNKRAVDILQWVG